MRMPFESEGARALNRDIFETMYFAAMTASCELAEKEGPYETFEGSPVSKGIFQFDMWGEVGCCRCVCVGGYGSSAAAAAGALVVVVDGGGGVLELLLLLPVFMLMLMSMRGEVAMAPQLLPVQWAYCRRSRRRPCFC